MAKIEGLTKLVSTLQGLAAKVKTEHEGTVVVGYTAAYALARHELPVGAPNPPKSDAQRKAMFASIHEREARGVKSWDQGQPKFLEQPARELTNNGTFKQIITTAVLAKKTLLQGLLMAGLRLQRESQLLVPLDTSNLKNSAFTRLETK
jgi:hypothetical protein